TRQERRLAAVTRAATAHLAKVASPLHRRCATVVRTAAAASPAVTVPTFVARADFLAEGRVATTTNRPQPRPGPRRRMPFASAATCTTGLPLATPQSPSRRSRALPLRAAQNPQRQLLPLFGAPLRLAHAQCVRLRPVSPPPRVPSRGAPLQLFARLP